MNELSKRYAQALFALTKDEKHLAEDTATLTGTQALWAALKNPCVSMDEKCAILERLFGESAEGLFLNFYRILCKRGRMCLLPQIQEAFHRCILESENRGEACMRCVIPPTSLQKEAICKALCRSQNKERVELTVLEDTALIGGFILELNGVSYDKSVRGTLQDMLERLQVR